MTISPRAAFSRGAPNQGLTWPGRYSHSPGEVLDLRDLDMLSRLIVAVASTRRGCPAKLARAVNLWLILRPSRADSPLLSPWLWQLAE